MTVQLLALLLAHRARWANLQKRIDITDRRYKLRDEDLQLEVDRDPLGRVARDVLEQILDLARCVDVIVQLRVELLLLDQLLRRFLLVLRHAGAAVCKGIVLTQVVSFRVRL